MDKGNNFSLNCSDVTTPNQAQINLETEEEAVNGFNRNRRKPEKKKKMKKNRLEAQLSIGELVWADSFQTT